MLNKINFNCLNLNRKNKIIVFPFSAQARSFSTSSKLYKDEGPNLDNLDYKSDQSLWKKKIQRDFKKAYGGGFLGYSYLYNFGYVSQFVNTIDTTNLQLDNDNLKAFEQVNLIADNKRLENLEILKTKLKDYLSVIPETETWSILPVVRWESSAEQYKSFTLSESIKMNKFVSTSLLAQTLLDDLEEIVREYYLRDADLELILMSRPWLDVDEFDLDRFLDRKSLADHFDEVLGKKIIGLDQFS